MSKQRRRRVVPRVHGERLRAALLAAIGFGPIVACGGAAENSATGGSAGAAGSAGSSVSDGGAVTAGGTKAVGGTTTVGGAAFPCEDPVPVDPNATYFQCKGGWLHRPESLACASALPRPNFMVPPTLAGFDQCRSDEDCAAVGPLAYCSPPQPGLAGNYCQQGCVVDSDCGPGAICLCGEPIGTCIRATCTSDAECGPNLLCSSISTLGCGIDSFLCQTAKDGCVSKAECGPNEECWPDALGVRSCQGIGCDIGRPFLVDGAKRVAGLAERSDWLRSSEPELAELTPELRARLAEHWNRAALMEHASVAAFARFTLELLMLGAPAELVEAAGRAQRDEIEHARLAFGLASAYAGRAQGPSPLDIEGSLGASGLDAVVTSAFLEGCVGETVAALEASVAAERAREPPVRAVLEQVARDEASHAELAFRFVKWALDSAGPGSGLGAHLAAELANLAAAARRASRTSTPADDELLARHGLLSDDERAAIFESARSEVIAPCVAALLAPRLVPSMHGDAGRRQAAQAE